MFLRIIFFLALFTPLFVNASTLSIIPGTGSLQSGQNITLTIRVSSPDQAVNAVSGSIAIPSNVSVVSLSKANSVINFWTTEPSVSGNTVSFEGVILNPGYQGSGRTVMTMTLQGNSVGTKDISFISGSVLANDGNGTETLKGMQGATISVTEGSSQPPPSEPSPPPPPKKSAGVVISSPTQPDQYSWYNRTDGTFVWNMPTGATEMRLLLDRSSSGAPSVLYSPPISEKTIPSLPEGTSYLHVQFRTGSGWGGVSTFRINIDTAPPQPFQVNFPHGNSGFDPKPAIIFTATDDVSGIDHYEVKVDGAAPLSSPAVSASNPFILPLQEPGSHTLVVAAFDRAGNATTASGGFLIKGIDPPKITSYQKELIEGAPIRFEGVSFPNSDIDLSVRNGSDVVDSESVKSDQAGNFSLYLTKHIGAGTYSVSARVTDARGARSPESAPVTFAVKSGFFGQVISFIINYLPLIVLALLSLIGLAVAGSWGWYKMRGTLMAVGKETSEAEATLHKSFSLLKKDIRAHVAKLERAKKSRALTEEEISFLNQFERDLGEAEHIIEDEIQDITK